MQSTIEGGAVARARQGDPQAFSELYARYSGKIQALCQRLTGDAILSEDLTQDAFVQALRKIGGFRGESAFSTWLYRVTVNVVLMNLRRGRRWRDKFVEVDLSLLPCGQIKAHDHLDLLRALAMLPPGFRRAIVLHEIGGYEHREIARLTGCSIGNSKSQLAKGKARLADLLDREAASNGKSEPRGFPVKNVKIGYCNANAMTLYN